MKTIRASEIKIAIINEFIDSKDKRNSYYDALKGAGILLVVIGHILQSTIQDYDKSHFFRYIYAFHMPFFMFVSGYLSYFSNYNRIQSLQKRFVNLIIPFISWALIKILLTQSSWKFIGDVFIKPDNGLWFLLILFEANVCLYLVKKFKYENVLFVIIWLGLYIISKKIDILGIQLLSWHWFFFASGYILNKYKKTISKFKLQISILCLILYSVLAFFWDRTDIYSGVKKIYELLGSATLVNSNENLFKFSALLYKYTVPLLGIGLFIGCIKLYLHMWKRSVISFLGFYSLEIYATHFCCLTMLPLISFSFSQINVFLNSILIIICTLFFIAAFKQVRIFNTILYGKSFSINK